MTSLGKAHGRQYMPCSSKFSMTYKLKFFRRKLQIFPDNYFFSSFNSVLKLKVEELFVRESLPINLNFVSGNRKYHRLMQSMAPEELGKDFDPH